MEIAEQIGYTIMVTRKEKNVSQEELAIRSGLSRATIASIESGRRIPSIDSLSCIARAFGSKLVIKFEDKSDFNAHISKLEDLLS